MLDKSIPYYNIIMKRKKGTKVPEWKLPEGYSFALYSEGDEKDWIEIETLVGEFDNKEEANECFMKDYFPYMDELKRRMLFIANKDNKKVATLTNWWNYTGKRRDPSFHWVGVSPEHQGLGLGKAIVFEGLNRMIRIEGDRDFFLHTQTWSYRAVNIYLQAGFDFVEEEAFAGYTNDYKKAMEILSEKAGTSIGSSYIYRNTSNR